MQSVEMSRSANRLILLTCTHNFLVIVFFNFHWGEFGFNHWQFFLEKNAYMCTHNITTLLMKWFYIHSHTTFLYHKHEFEICDLLSNGAIYWLCHFNNKLMSVVYYIKILVIFIHANRSSTDSGCINFSSLLWHFNSSFQNFSLNDLHQL